MKDEQIEETIKEIQVNFATWGFTLSPEAKEMLKKFLGKALADQRTQLIQAVKSYKCGDHKKLLKLIEGKE